jgi:hypothetical protein
MRTAGRYLRERIRRHRIGPGGRQAPQLARVIEKVNPLLTPSHAPLDQHELASKEGVKGMDYPKDFFPINCIMCSWLLI